MSKYRKRRTVSMTEALYFALKIEAAEHGETMSGYVTKLLESRISRSNITEGESNAEALYLMRKRRHAASSLDVMDSCPEHTPPSEPELIAKEVVVSLSRRDNGLTYVEPETRLKTREMLEEEDFFGGVKTL